MKAVHILLVIAVLAGGVGAGFWWLDQSTGLDTSEPAVVSEAPPAISPPVPTADESGYDVNQAYNIAGSHVPETVRDFYLYHVEVEEELGAQAESLASLMRSAQKDSDFLAVIGANPLLTYDVFNAALDMIGNEPLGEVTFIYLGRADHQAAVRERVELKGAELRFSEYPKSSV